MKELYALSSYALSDLVEIWDYIRQDDPDAADRVEAELLEKCESLARMPGQGHRRSDYTKANVLFVPAYSYLIAYRPGTDPLQILAIIHGARQVRKVLKERGV
ncbi:MAG: type II toxin-antitoxin system RelE/ParE family toxin [Acidobacteriia bacterium]|nr:type II toxin-antitoxin system RelE/ParE family toxin [Terriglobia bacterium]